MREAEYKREEAVKYAKEWALKRNPLFYDYSGIGGDCTSFASQCIYAGSNIMNYTPTFGWYYVDGNDKSPSWSGVSFLYNFLTENMGIGPYGAQVPLSSLLPGDIIQLGNAKGDFYHSLVLTYVRYRRGVKSYYVCAHNQDAYQRNLRSYNYRTIRGIHIFGVRKPD